MLVDFGYTADYIVAADYCNILAVYKHSAVGFDYIVADRYIVSGCFDYFGYIADYYTVSDYFDCYIAVDYCYSVADPMCNLHYS
jgi:hypothetical protein